MAKETWSQLCVRMIGSFVRLFGESLGYLCCLSAVCTALTNELRSVCYRLFWPNCDSWNPPKTDAITHSLTIYSTGWLYIVYVTKDLYLIGISNGVYFLQTEEHCVIRSLHLGKISLEVIMTEAKNKINEKAGNNVMIINWKVLLR